MSQQLAKLISKHKSALNFKGLDDAQSAVMRSTSMPVVLRYIVKEESRLSQPMLNRFKRKLISLSNIYIAKGNSMGLDIKEPVDDLLKFKEPSLLAGFVRNLNKEARQLAGLGHSSLKSIVRMSFAGALDVRFNRPLNWNDEKVNAAGEMFLKYSASNADGIVKFVLKNKNVLKNIPDYMDALAASSDFKMNHADTLFRRNVLNEDEFENLKGALLGKSLRVLGTDEAQMSFDFGGDYVGDSIRDDEVLLKRYQVALRSKSLSAVVKCIKRGGDDYAQNAVEALNMKVDKLTQKLVSQVNSGNTDMEDAYRYVLKVDDEHVKSKFLKGVDDVSLIGAFSKSGEGYNIKIFEIGQKKEDVKALLDEIHDRVAQFNGSDEFIKAVEGIYLSSKHVSTNALVQFAYNYSDVINNDIEYVNKLVERNNLRSVDIRMLNEKGCFGEYGETVFTKTKDEINFKYAGFTYGGQDGQLELDISGINLKTDSKNGVVIESKSGDEYADELVNAFEKSNKSKVMLDNMSGPKPDGNNAATGLYM